MKSTYYKVRINVPTGSEIIYVRNIHRKSDPKFSCDVFKYDKKLNAYDRECIITFCEEPVNEDYTMKKCVAKFYGIKYNDVNIIDIIDCKLFKSCIERTQ